MYMPPERDVLKLLWSTRIWLLYSKQMRARLTWFSVFFAWRIYACERLDPVRHSHWWLMLMFTFLSTDSTDFASRPEAKHEKPQKFWRFVMTCMPWGNFAQSSSSREARHRPVTFKARSWPPLGHKLCSPSYRYILPCIREPRLSRPVIWRSSACTMQLRPEVPR